MTAEERAVRIVTLFQDARDRALAGELDDAIEIGTEAVFLARQARDEHMATFLEDDR